MHSYPLIRILREKEKRKNAFVSVNSYIKRKRKKEKMHSYSLIRILREK